VGYLEKGGEAGGGWALSVQRLAGHSEGVDLSVTQLERHWIGHSLNILPHARYRKEGGAKRVTT
jgi:hypothetical protein